MRTLKNIDPSPEQLRILSDANPGFRLIHGAAGSGKTTAALLRLRQLCASRLSRRQRLRSEKPVRVLVLTFNQTLCGYISELTKEQFPASEGLDLTIDTFGRWALHRVGQRKVIDETMRRNQIRTYLLDAGCSRKNLEYFVDEVDYVNGRFLPVQREKYLKARREGRGIAPAAQKRVRQRLLTNVIKRYDAYKLDSEVSDWNDIAVKACNNFGDGYDVVVVDEAQDLSGNQIRAILASLNEDHATTFIMDTVQRIYPHRFHWQEVGIRIMPHMVFTQTCNHRNTVEIAKFAASLVRGLPVEEDGLVPDEKACEPSGPIPRLVAGTFASQLEFMMNEIQLALKYDETVVILHPKGGRWFNYARQTLEQSGINFCEITRKRKWPTGPELVALSTIHSAKGLEFDHVLLPGLNQEVTPHGNEDGDGTLEALRRLVAMGIGRARKSVMIGYKPGEESTLIAMFDQRSLQQVEV